jgi:DNA-binding CsgD family transcriptional regulator
VAGKGNKEIAHILDRSIRTVEDHRANIMLKLGADNIVDLIKKVSLPVTM